MTITRQQWSEEHIQCMNPACLWHSHRGLDKVYRITSDGEMSLCNLHTHEIPRGPHKAAAMTEPAAWLRLCSWCHEDEPWNRTGQNATRKLLEQLVWKKWFDGEHYDRARVLELKHLGSDAVTEDEVDEELRRRLK